MTDDKSEKATKPWEWSLEEIKQKLNVTVRTGRALIPKAWPNGAKVAVCFSVDIDNESEHLASADLRNPTSLELSNNQYGARQGIPRMVKLFDRYGIPCTFFTPIISAMLAPKMFDHILHSGNHELAAHGWIHESPARLTREEHYDLLSRSQQYLEQISGKKITGYRAPLAEVVSNTIPLLKELGFIYDSTFCADDMPYELLMDDGSGSGIIELPASLTQEDGALIPMDNGWSNGMLAPMDLLQVHKDSFDIAYEEGTMLTFILHPHVSGRRSRVAALERLINYMKSKPDVWFATMEQVAMHVKKEFQL